MEKSVSKVVGANLFKLRKTKKITQLELAKQINFSDKTISKWESGESLPSIDVLSELAKFYDVTMNDLVDPNYEPEQKSKKLKPTAVQIKKIIISLLSITILWLILTVIFVYSKIYANVSIWPIFVWGVPISLFIAIIFNKFWGGRKLGVYLTSALIWSFLVAVYMQFMDYSLWVIFILGVPIQTLIVLWYGLKKQTDKLKQSKS